MKKIVMTVMLYAVLCASVFAQKENDYKINNDGIITAYDGWDTVIVIPAQIGGIPVKGIGNGVFKNMGITGVTLPAGITHIGGEAFKDNKLTSVTIGNNVSIGSEAFTNNKLTRITMGTNVSIGNSAFSDNQLVNLTLGNNIFIAQRAFSRNQLASITLGEKVTISESSFSDNKLISFTMGKDGFIAANAFYSGSEGNNGLKTLVLGAGINIERNAFRIGYYYSSFNPSSYYDYMCNSRKAATYDNLAVYAEKKEGDYSFIQTKYGVVITNYTGNEGNRLQIPGKLGGVAVTGIGENAFKSKNISRMQLPEGLIFIDNDAFAGNQLTSVTIPNSVTGIGSGVFAYCGNLTGIIIPDSVKSSIGNSAFRNCSNLTNITIGSGVTYIGWNAFQGCTSLTSVTIPDSVISIERGAFSGCEKLTSVKFQGIITKNNLGTYDQDGDYSPPFNGDLHKKYLEGGIGTYVRSGSYSWNYTWTKQQE